MLDIVLMARRRRVQARFNASEVPQLNGITISATPQSIVNFYLTYPRTKKQVNKLAGFVFRESLKFEGEPATVSLIEKKNTLMYPQIPKTNKPRRTRTK